MSATKVATSTSTSSAAPWSGSSRRSTAWANGIAIQTIPSTVTAIESVIPVAIRARDGGDEDQRHARRERDHHLVLVAVEGGRDERRRGDERGDQERPCLAGHAEELGDPDAGEADHRDREQLAADDHDRDHDRDPRQHPGDPRQGLGAAAPRRLAVRAPVAAAGAGSSAAAAGRPGGFAAAGRSRAPSRTGAIPPSALLTSPEPPPRWTRTRPAPPRTRRGRSRARAGR